MNNKKDIELKLAMGVFEVYLECKADFARTDPTDIRCTGYELAMEHYAEKADRQIKKF